MERNYRLNRVELKGPILMVPVWQNRDIYKHILTILKIVGLPNLYQFKSMSSPVSRCPSYWVDRMDALN